MYVTRPPASPACARQQTRRHINEVGEKKIFFIQYYYLLYISHKNNLNLGKYLIISRY